MTVENEILNRKINAALNKSSSQIASQAAASALREQTAREISQAVEEYVEAKLQKLKLVLTTPGVFIGAGTGVVTVTAPGLAAYNPSL
jgi:DNA-binding protein YbaB